jgi:hypothetical protein
MTDTTHTLSHTHTQFFSQTLLLEIWVKAILGGEKDATKENNEGSYMNDVTQFLIILKKPPPIVALFIYKVLVM